VTGGATTLGRSARRLLVLLLALGVVASACTSDGASTAGGQTEVTPTEVRVTTLQRVSRLAERFNADVGTVRLVLLLSPT
jgi:ABC-type glycerol-3-phosphate transport system substrate-binding protein